MCKEGIPQGLKPLAFRTCLGAKPEGLAYLEARTKATTKATAKATAKATTDSSAALRNGNAKRLRNGNAERAGRNAKKAADWECKNGRGPGMQRGWGGMQRRLRIGNAERLGRNARNAKTVAEMQQGCGGGYGLLLRSSVRG